MRRAILSGFLVLSLPLCAGWSAEPPVAPVAKAPAAATPAEQSPTTEASAKETLAARTTSLLRATAAALQSRSIEPAEEGAFRDLLAAAEQLKADKTLAPSERDRLRALARVRLRQATEVLAKQTAKGAAAMKDSSAKPATIQTPASPTLAQQLQVPGGAGAGFLAGAGAGNTPGGQSAAELESAKQLMDVITASIQPESWEEVGGRGVIRYWALGHALVIRNTSDVHGGVADVIQQLRK